MTVNIDSFWMQTYTGKRFYPTRPEPDMVDIKDIAHALALQCRFGGHINKPFSVAQHSLEVAKMLPVPIQVYGLLHDGAETYTNDVPRPVKNALGDKIRNIEKTILGVIHDKYELPYPVTDEVYRMINRADNILLASEAKAFFDVVLYDWYREFAEEEELVDVDIMPYQEAEALFEYKFEHYLEEAHKCLTRV